MISSVALLGTVLPGIFGVTLFLTGRYVRKRAGFIATAVSASSFFLILSMANPVASSPNSGQGSLAFVYPWIGPVNISFGLLIDTVSFPIGLIIALVSTLSCLYSVRYMDREANQAGYYANLLIFMTGMIGVVFSSNLIQFYLFWELMLIPSCILIARWGKSRRRLRIAFKYFIFTHIGALLVLLGILSIFSYTMTFDLVELPSKLATIPPNMTMMIFILLLLGFFVKMAAFPLHTWLPDTYSAAPIPVTAMLSGAMAKCGAYGIARILLPMFTQRMMQFSDWILIFGIITMLYGGLITFAQTDLNRMLAYSSMSQMGYIIFGFGTATTLGIMGSLLHIANHAVSKSLLFLCAGTITQQTGTRDIRRLSGLMSKMPATGFALLIGALSLAGIPPLNGFWSEWMIFGGGLSSGKIILTFLGVATAMITPSYFIWFSRKILLGTSSRADITEAPRPLLLPILTLTSISIVLGIWPTLLLEFIAPAARLLSLDHP
ncbi:MAG: NuoM family protein [Candidatus Bathyarchaeia archaeon]